MKTRFEKKIYGAAASALLLLLLTGCGSSTTMKSDSASGSQVASSSGSSGGTTGTGVGAGTYTNPLPVSTPWANARIANGDAHTCLLDTGGGVWCWGRNRYGQLGNGSLTDAKFVTRASNLTSGVLAIAAGGFHTCALDSGGGVWCWGSNDAGQLGDGTKTDRSVPTQVSGLSSGVQALAVGFEHTCAIKSNNAVTCWGSNQYGQLGNGSTTDSSYPVLTAGFSGGAHALALGYHHSCATNQDGGLFCWGYNNSGRLGDGTTTNRSIPTPVSGLSLGVQTVSAGYIHTCAVDSNGGLWCWGANNYGQLGNGSTTSSSFPVQVAGLTIGVQTLSLGGYHTCVTDGGSDVSCWGYGVYGQAGNGSFTSQSLPVAVTGINGPVRGLASGGYHSCTLDASGVQCWGDDYYGELGDGTFTNSAVPVGVTNVNPPQ